MQKLKKGDEIIVITGKDKGKLGKILSFDNNRVVVSGINKVKKHQKANPNAGISGGVIEKEMPIDISNIALYNPKTKKADKVRFANLDGKKIRVFKSDNQAIS